MVCLENNSFESVFIDRIRARPHYGRVDRFCTWCPETDRNEEEYPNGKRQTGNEHSARKTNRDPSQAQQPASSHVDCWFWRLRCRVGSLTVRADAEGRI